MAQFHKNGCANHCFLQITLNQFVSLAYVGNFNQIQTQLLKKFCNRVCVLKDSISRHCSFKSGNKIKPFLLQSLYLTKKGRNKDRF